MPVLELLEERHLDEREGHLAHGGRAETREEAAHALAAHAGHRRSEGRWRHHWSDGLHALLEHLAGHAHHASGDIGEGGGDGVPADGVALVLQGRRHVPFQEVPGVFVDHEEDGTSGHGDHDDSAEATPGTPEAAGRGEALRSLHPGLDGVQGVQRDVHGHARQEASNHGDRCRWLRAELSGRTCLHAIGVPPTAGATQRRWRPRRRRLRR
mmetsp:Transcript_48111/g.136692  ORF Transcript_48111/g.136692 Transcript_48111/m.136692 type:complete len:211 (-) Transcript_48111:26-658(-)